jgi:hypothetical protein
VTLENTEKTQECLNVVVAAPQLLVYDDEGTSLKNIRTGKPMLLVASEEIVVAVNAEDT